MGEMRSGGYDTPDMLPNETMIREPERMVRMQIPGRANAASSARSADLALLAMAPNGFLDTTHFDTVRFPPPEWAAEVFSAAAADGEMAYSGYRGHSHILEQVADNLSHFLEDEIDPASNLIVTPGTQGGLFCSLSALVSPGDRVAIGCPEYLFSERMLKFLGADTTAVPLLIDRAASTPDLDVLEREFRDRGARIFIFSNPNNPTGTVYGHETLSRIAELCVRYNITVVVDELYARLLHDGGKLVHLRNLPGMAERTVTLLGPSKTESLSGYRLGVVVAPPYVIQRMENIQSITALRAPAYAQALLPHWMRDDEDWLAARMPDFTALRSLTEGKLKRLPWVGWQVGQGTAYAWVNVGALSMPSDAVSRQLMTGAGVLVSPGYQFGPGCDDYFRVCYARDEKRWSDALDRMVGVLAALGAKRGLPGPAA